MRCHCERRDGHVSSIKVLPKGSCALFAVYAAIELWTAERCEI